MLPLADGLWIKHYPLSVLATQHGRTATVLALSSGKLVIHSMAPFSSQDVAKIRSLGEVGWLAEAMLLHDTYAKQGRDTFPGVPFLGPPGFEKVVSFPTTPLLPVPAEWAGEIDVVALEGAERLKEHVFLHVASRALVVADLVFNFRPDERGWNFFFHRYLGGMHRYPAMSRIFRLCIQDRAAFRESIDQVMALDFDRIIVGHGNVIETNGKALLHQALNDAGLLR